MARQNQANEFNTFVGGLVTEASPLTFPPNTARDINNYNINRNGSISRRLGVDYESGYVIIDSGVSPGAGGEVAVNVFSWDNAGGTSNLRLRVVQTGNVLKFFNTTDPSISSSLIHTHTFSSTDKNKDYSADVVDGVLVVATGVSYLTAFTYKDGVITSSQLRLKIRDLFGVEDVVDGEDLRSSSFINKRPLGDSYTANHIYNLRNSTFNQLRVYANEEYTDDPIYTFLVDHIAETTVKRFPSNADSVTSALFADANDSDDRNTERFFPTTLIKSPSGNFQAATGYFIIDALDRGASRLQEIQKLYNTSTKYNYTVSALASDRTPGGASVVAQFAGRMFYSGFSGEVVDGDRHSPKMSSYVLFSKLVKSEPDLSVCHQEGDPTSKEAPDVIDTDGGFIKLDGAYGITKMASIGDSLIVFAENGVWAITGGSDYGFTALAYKVTKLSEHGCVSPGSVVLVDNSLLYWGSDAIYRLGPDQFGALTTTNATSATIQTYYDNILDTMKRSCKGYFDSYERKVRWVYGGLFATLSDTSELIFDVSLSAFYRHTLVRDSLASPYIIAPFEVPPFRIGDSVEDIVYGTEPVYYDSAQVQHTTSIKVNGIREIKYVSIVSTSPTVKYTVALYKDISFLDWVSHDSVGVDSAAYLLTGFEGGGDYQRYKQVPYITFHLTRTEDGFEDIGGDLVPKHQSSCLVQSQWDWANSVNSGRWSRPFQAYRYKRFYMPSDVNDQYDTGFLTIITKNKLRGKGKVLSLLITTEAGKDCKLLGWSTLTSVGTNV